MEEEIEDEELDDEQEYLQKIIESQKLIDSVGEAEFAKMMFEKRSEMEDLFRSYSPFTDTNAINIIVDCALILDAYHSKQKKPNTKRREQFEHLLVSCFNVGYALGVGKDCPAALPILALSGVNMELGKKLLLEYKSHASENDSSEKE